jgi:hypothetical protein
MRLIQFPCQIRPASSTWGNKNSYHVFFDLNKESAMVSLILALPSGDQSDNHVQKCLLIFCKRISFRWPIILMCKYGME